jgi:hypothetical protein
VGTGRPEWAPVGLDLDRPSAARVWDYFLGGSHNFAVDRQVAEAAIAMKPDMPELAAQVRRFLQRAVRYMAGAGIRQIIDIGAGIPTVGNVHEVAQQIDPSIRVVYVDHDPVAVAHGRTILAADPKAKDRVVAIQGDLRDPDAILADPQLRALVDFRDPVGYLLIGILHFVVDQDPTAIVANLRDAAVPGSYLAIQHATHDEQDPATIEMLEMWNSRSPEPMRWRSRAEIGGLFKGFTLLDPGVVFLSRWRPDPDEEPDPQAQRFASYTAVGRKD